MHKGLNILKADRIYYRRGDSLKILVVDDEENNVNFLVRKLTKLGYEVFQARNGLDAIDLVDREKFDLILLDVMMP
ncbi:response regulator [Desulfosporosinus sp. Sb-LF]|nr:response regulator [Desulfosporosinus sp. Sb-LF]